MTITPEGLRKDDLLLDNAATCSQHPALEDLMVRECITLNIINPLRTALAAALEELARLKAPVEVAGIVARIDDELPSFDHTLAPMGVASLLRDCRAALESLAAKVKALEEEIAKLKGHAEAMAIDIRAMQKLLYGPDETVMPFSLSSYLRYYPKEES